MGKIKLGSLCITKIVKTFKIKSGDVVVPKGTLVLVCDDDNIKDGFVLVEADEYGYALDYKEDELIFIK